MEVLFIFIEYLKFLFSVSTFFVPWSNTVHCDVEKDTFYEYFTDSIPTISIFHQHTWDSGIYGSGIYGSESVYRNSTSTLGWESQNGYMNKPSFGENVFDNVCKLLAFN